MARSTKSRRAGPPVAPAPTERADAREMTAWPGILMTAAIVLYAVVFLGTPLDGLPLRTAGGAPYDRGEISAMAVVASLVGLDWLSNGSLWGLLERVGLLLATSVYLTSATLGGWAVLRAVPAYRRLSELEMILFSTGLGLSLFSVATLLLGLAGALDRSWFVVLLTLGPVAALLSRRGQRGQQLISEETPPQPDPSPAVRWLAVPTVVVLLTAMLPPVDFDVREYHLQAPKEFYQLGQITFLPHNIYANMPLGAEMHALAAMVLTGNWGWGALIGKTVLAAMAMLTALGLFALGARFASPLAGLVAAVGYLATPWVMLVSTSGLIDGAVGYFGLLGVYAMVLLVREGDTPTGDRYLLAALAGCFAGAAAACKYPAVVFYAVPLFAALLVATAVRGNSRNAIACSAWFLLAAALTGGPWLVKNAVQTSNPVYPLLYGVFDGRTRTSEKHAQWVEAHNAENFSLGELTSCTKRVLLTSEWLSPILWPLALGSLVLLRRKSNTAPPGRRWLVGSLWSLLVYDFAVWWLFTHRIDRFLVPALPLLALLAGMGASTAYDRRMNWWLRGAMIFAIGYGSTLALAGLFGDNRVLAPLVKVRDSSRLTSLAHHYLNDPAQQVSTVLLVGDAQPFDLESRALYNTCFDDNLLELLTRDRSTDEIRQAFAEQQISHVLVDWGEIARYRSPGNYGFTDYVQPELFKQWQADGLLELVLDASDESRQLYRVLPQR